jgi:HD-GYP domain-containing protein (c-di-GMP phosphodiesterase class II)
VHGPSHEPAHLLGDDLAATPRTERTDIADRRELLALTAATGKGTGVHRVRYLARTLAAGRQAGRVISRAVCEVGALMAERLRLGDGVRRGLFHSLERWDGRGEAHGLAGEEVALPARLTVVAAQAVILDRLGGPDAAMEMVRRRAGGWFDPAVAAAFERAGPALLRRLAEADVWAEVLAAGCLRLPDGDVALVRRAALLHDLGRVAVSSHVWERPGALTAAQREQVRLHPYHSERILVRSAALQPLARIAGMHHERQDGSGYHHGAPGAQVPVESRLLAAADAYQAMTQDRPYRAALAPAAAAREVEAAARSGRFDPECARAVIEAAGQRATRTSRSWPAGLSEREVEVLRLVARGLSNRQIAAALFISPRTAEHHVQHIYAKIGASTRAAAAMFAMEHGLLR